MLKEEDDGERRRGVMRKKSGEGGIGRRRDIDNGKRKGGEQLERREDIGGEVKIVWSFYIMIVLCDDHMILFY